MSMVKDVEEIAQRAALQGALALMDHYGHTHQMWPKSSFELVTEADMASEEAIVSEIRRSCSDHTILTEEKGELAGDPDHVWIVDPLDGTLKYVLGEPYFSISIAYESRGLTQFGLVYNPCTQDAYVGRLGKGAFRNGVALSVARADDLATAFACCDWGNSAARQQQGLRYLARLLPPITRGVGVNFSPALDLCNLAAGNIAAMISNGTTAMDHAAGALIVMEAGGDVTNFGQADWSHRFEGVIATNSPAMSDTIRQLLNTCVGGGVQSRNGGPT